MAMTVLLADDHSLVRDGLKPFILQLDAEVTVREAASYDDVMAVVNETETPLHLVLLDLNMPGMPGLEAVATVREARPETPVVILTGMQQPQMVREADRLGASGFVPKTISGASMVNALRLVLSGEKFLPSTILAAEAAEEEGMALDPTGVAARVAQLTPREKDILRHLARGGSNKEIARDLTLQEVTVKVHLKKVFRKLGVSSRVQAARLAWEAGLESPDSETS